MIVASSTPHHSLDISLSAGESPRPVCRLQRRNTVSDSRSVLVAKAMRKNRPLLRSRPTNLDSVIEQADSFSECSHQSVDIVDKKRSTVYDVYKRDSSSTPVALSLPHKASTLPRSFSRKHTNIVNGMAWKPASKQQSPPPPVTSGGEPSWLGTISTKLSEKKRKSGIFGSLRGRNRDKKKDPVETKSNGGGNNPRPRSPLLAAATNSRRSSNDSTTDQSKKSPLQTKPSFGFQGSSVGFQYAASDFSRPPVDLTDSGVLEYHSRLVGNSPLSPVSGSTRDLSSQKGLGINQVALVRKTNSLPRTVLCSPVASRKNKPRHENQVTYRDIVADGNRGHSFSPPSSNMSSRVGSVDTLQPSVNMSEEQGGVSVVTPTEGWHNVHTPVRAELVHKTSLTRSSSLPFEAEILISEQSVGRDVGGAGKEGRGISELSTSVRMATRSQSFNANFSSHSVLKKTASYEEKVMRERVLSFLLETEQSYIHSLKVLTEEYSSVLLTNGLMDDPSVGELFMAVEGLRGLHQSFADKVEDRLYRWSRNEVIGDILLDMFTSSQLASIYGTYIQHYSKARSVIEAYRQSRPSFVRELEECNRDNHSRLDLKDLLIKPVQRIPRYMLFVKDIIKYTSHAHSDHLMLKQALNELTELAECVNESERLSDMMHQHKELLTSVDGLAECLTGTSVLLRCDVVTEMKGSVQKKERLLMLFSDTVVCAAMRRKSSGFRRGSLMNINSTQVAMETVRYQVKWYSQLSSLSVTHSQAPLLERRRYNTLEKLLHSSQRDEALLIQMMSLSSSLHTNHHQLNCLLQDMLDQLRSGMSNRQLEIETLPHDSARLDLISHDSIPAAKYLLLLSNQKERQQWEHTLRNAQLSSGPLGGSRLQQIEEYDYPLRPPNGGPGRVNRQSSLKTPTPKLLSHLSLPSCRVGSQLSSAAVSTGQLFVTINDSGGRGSVAIVNTSKGASPRLIATLPLSSTNLLCSTCVTHPRGNSAGDASFSLSESGDIPFFNDSTQLCPTPLSAAVKLNTSLRDNSYEMLRSSSAPPTSFQRISNEGVVPNGWSQTNEQWLWLGSEGGVVYLLKVGVSSLHVGSSVSFNLKSSVECLLFHNNKVWAGLRDGRLAVFQLQPDINFNYCDISSKPITCLSPAGHMILAAAGNTIVGVSSLTEDYKEQLELEPHLQIVGVAISERLVFLSILDSLVIYIYTFSGNGCLEVLCTMDCAGTVMSMLKNCDPIVKQHKCSYPRVTTLSCTDHTLSIGTSTGILLYLPLPLLPGHTPLSQPLTTGHVDEVSVMTMIGGQGNLLLMTGGHGLEDFSKGRLYNNVSETEGCVTLWRLPNSDKHL